MSRSKYVSVGDTGGLILDSKYDDFVTNAQLGSKLGGIENKLVALEQKLTDGSQKAQLSGTMVELLDSGAFYADGSGGKHTTVRYDLNEYNNVILEIAAPYAIKVEILVGENENLIDEMIVNSGSYLIGTYSSVKFILQPLGSQGETVYAIKGVRLR
ncbi:MAG TPA: hypothetical protein GX745_07150 [Clostridiales bacterium]|nr:hypothetical protein [Clostridiales bacterium]